MLVRKHGCTQLHWETIYCLVYHMILTDMMLWLNPVLLTKYITCTFLMYIIHYLYIGYWIAATRWLDSSRRERSNSQWRTESQSESGQGSVSSSWCLSSWWSIECSRHCSQQAPLWKVQYKFGITVIAMYMLRCICGLLSDKAVILVTHQIQYLKQCDTVLGLKEVRNPIMYSFYMFKGMHNIVWWCFRYSGE